VKHRIMIGVSTVLIGACQVVASGQEVKKPAGDAPGKGPVFNRVRFFPAPMHEAEMVGGTFSGSNRSATSGFTILAEIKHAPRTEEWTEISFPNEKVYRWLRYEAPAGSFGRMAEVEFHAGERKLNGQGYGTIGEQPGRAWTRALDGNPKTWFESESADDQYVGLDLGEVASVRRPRMEPAPGEQGQAVKVSLQSPSPGASIRYTLDGTTPGPRDGTAYTDPVAVDTLATLTAVAFKEDEASSPPSQGTYLIGDSARPGLSTFHIGNSLTNTTARFADQARTAGYRHTYVSFTGPGAWTNQLWNFKEGNRKAEWEKTLAKLSRIDHFTVQPRDFNIAEEADYDKRFFEVVRRISPDVQPWLYVEWTEKARQRPTDKGTVPSYQMKKTFPALTWEESMAGMLLYVEELQHRLREIDQQGKRPRVLPSALAMGWIKNMIDRGQVPGVSPGSFYAWLYRDQVHPNANGAYLVDLTWFAAIYGESPVGKVLPTGTTLSHDQSALMQRLAWEVIKNYPDCALYEEGTTPAGTPEFSAAPATPDDNTPVTFTSATPGAWFRYTLDGSTPTRQNGYVYCGVVTVRPGMTLKAVAYKSGTADSPVAEATYPASRR
jgi:Chitobiase/beta-hexosaminidase C-terminal domain/Fn3 associated